MFQLFFGSRLLFVFCLNSTGSGFDSCIGHPGVGWRTHRRLTTRGDSTTSDCVLLLVGGRIRKRMEPDTANSPTQEIRVISACRDHAKCEGKVLPEKRSDQSATSSKRGHGVRRRFSQGTRMLPQKILSQPLPLRRQDLASARGADEKKAWPPSP